MTHAEFNALLERRIDLTRRVLAAKSAEYSTGEDKLHNFKQAAVLLNRHPGTALLGMLVKHWVSVQDLLQQFFAGGGDIPSALIDEKIGDSINYLILLEAILKE